ncbi:hypothetical protein PybrP1_009856 [[Pythium] brassicae (nom. inval.)]|nr:hypothetical protein PybrP1_009856 [[Pythium] brassicae (nom. inval.)]
MHVDLAEEVVGGVLLAAEHLAGAVVAAERGTLEALRWAGALPLLLRDLGARKVVDAEALWATGDDRDDAQRLLGRDSKLVLLLAGFLWDYEARLARLLRLGVVRHVVVASSLSERAHECADVAAVRRMDFRAFAASLAPSYTPSGVVARPVAAAPTTAAVRAKAPAPAAEDEWGWNDDNDDSDNADKDDDMGASNETDQEGDEDEDATDNKQAPATVEVVQLPLHFAALLTAKTRSPEPSVFVLCHPLCAAAFPLLLSHVVGPDGALVGRATPSSSSLSSVAPPAPASLSLPPAPTTTYAHAKDVALEHIPSDFRRALRLLAHTLGEMLVGMRLDFKERIFTLGATSLKIGHTLQRIVNELHADLDIHTVQSHQAATVILIDRTSDLATPTAFGVSLLDRILALLPQTPARERPSSTGRGVRQELHVTEIFPLHGCEPSPLSVSPSLLADELVSFRTSAFLASVQWKGGASLCHPTVPGGASAFRSLAFRPAKLALRDLDKRLQEVEGELVRQRKIAKTGSTRRPGEKKQPTRGRDVVLRRLCAILDAGEPTDAAHSALVELGVLVLETLERMETRQPRWDKCRERAARQIQLRRQGGREWILPELADAIQRGLAAGGGAPGETASLQELLTLLVHAFTLSAGAPVEEYTLQMIRGAVSESILEIAVRDPESVAARFPELSAAISVFVARHPQGANEKSTAASGTARASLGGDFDDDEWDWNDSSGGAVEQSGASTGGASQADALLRLETKAVVEAYVERLFQPLKECAQQFATMNDTEYASAVVESPRSLIAQICSAVLDPATTRIPELEHIVDASEQLTRAGIDMLKSGFSRFGLGGGASGPRTGIQHQLAASAVVVVFVVGGITFEEIQEVHDALGADDRAKHQIILGGTTVTNSEIILEELFKSLRL